MPALPILEATPTQTDIAAAGQRSLSPLPPDFYVAESPPSSLFVGEHQTICLGGTFDHFHAGHKILLTVAALWSRERVMCGVTVPSMLTKKAFAHHLESYQHRCAAITNFVGVVRKSVVGVTVPIEDTYGNTVSVPELTALVVSAETQAGGEAINAERIRRGYKPMTIHAVSLVKASAAAADGDLDSYDPSGIGKLSSTLIRKYLDTGDLTLFA